MGEKSISLPKPDTKGQMPLEESILKRRSERLYTDKELTLEQIGQLLWSAQGITSERGYRSAPSAGALYPMEVYIATSDGLYHYVPEGHSLRVVQKGDVRGQIATAAHGQDFVETAPVVIIICAVYDRVTSKYKRHGIRYVDMEAGHIAQNIHLQAVALGLGSVPVGAFRDDDLSLILPLPKDHKPIYIVPVGYIK